MAEPKTTATGPTGPTFDATAEAKAAADSTTKVMEDVLAKAQAQYLAILSETQNVALDAYKTMVDSVGKLNLPSMPDLPGMAGFTQTPANMIEGAFDFGLALLENQRSFAKKVFEVSAS